MSSSCHQHRPAPPGHRLDQPLQVVSVHSSHPESLHSLNDLGGRVGVHVLQLRLHPAPDILDWVQVGAVPWPVDHVPALPLQELGDPVGTVQRGSILEECVGAMKPHERSQVLLEAVQVDVAIHHDVLGEEEESSPPSPREARPDHHLLAVFDCGLAELRVEPVGADLPPDPLGRLLPDGLEVTFVTEHDVLPLLLCPPDVLPGEVESLELHGLRQQRLQCHRPRPHFHLLCQHVLDRPAGHVPQLWDLVLELPGCQGRSHGELSLQLPLHVLGDLHRGDSRRDSWRQRACTPEKVLQSAWLHPSQPDDLLDRAACLPVGDGHCLGLCWSVLAHEVEEEVAAASRNCEEVVTKL